MQGIKITLPVHDIEGLICAFRHILGQLPDRMDGDEYMLLLNEHAIEISAMLEKLYSRNPQKKYTFGLRASDARAMMQLLAQPFALTPHMANSIRRLISLIDQTAVSERWILPQIHNSKKQIPNHTN